MYVFNVPGMTCGHCARTVSQAVRSADPEAQVEVSIGEHLVKVESELTSQEIAQRIAEAGYPTQAV